MARQFLLLFACIFALNVSLVLSREDYYQHFSNIFSHHHRRSTPDADVVSTEIPVTVTGGMPHADASRSTINYAKKTTGERVEVIQKGFDNEGSSVSVDGWDTTVTVLIIVSIVIGSILFLCCIFGLTALCIKNFCLKRRPGLILFKPAMDAVPILRQEEPLAQEQAVSYVGRVEMQNVSTIGTTMYPQVPSSSNPYTPRNIMQPTQQVYPMIQNRY